MISVLNGLKNEFEAINIPYEFDSWESKVKLPFFVGEISETPTIDEDGKRVFDFILTGEDVDTYTRLLNYNELIRERFKNGRKIMLDDGAMVIAYENIITVPVEDERTKRIQINITVIRWEGE